MVSRPTLLFRVVVLVGLFALLITGSFARSDPGVMVSDGSAEGAHSTWDVASQAPTTGPRGGVVVANVTVGRIPAWVAYDEANRYVYVTNDLSNSTSVISGTSVVATVPVEIGPHGIAYDQRNREVYVVNSIYPSNSVSVINGTVVVATIPTIGGPWAAAYDSNNGYVYITLPGFYGLNVINETTVIANITAGIGLNTFPEELTYDSGNGNVYVGDYGSDTVNVISGTAVIANITVGSQPAGLGYDSSNGYIYVANEGSNTVSVINGTTVVATLPVGLNPRGVAYANSNGYVYVTDETETAAGSVSVINDTTVIDTIPVGDGPWGIGYDGANRYLYVAIASSTGLDPGVNVISTSTDYSLSNGGPVNVLSGGTGNVTVTTTLTASPTVRLTLSCYGLPSGITCQSFSVNPVTPTVAGSESMLKIGVASSAIAGTYSFSVTSTPLGSTTIPTNVTVIVAKPTNLILGLNPTTLYAIVAVSIVAIVAAVFITYLRTRRQVSPSRTGSPQSSL
jgi:YVTN family beta-propeller protein